MEDANIRDQSSGEQDSLNVSSDNEMSYCKDVDYQQCSDHIHCDSLQKLRILEEDQELLNSSLFALTTHFAQVQFRLRQIVNSKPEDREELLKSLEEFAFRGVPDMGFIRKRINDTNLMEVRKIQHDLISTLKSQLQELERYAFENGEADIPQDIILERQRVILNELKNRMNLEIDERSYHQLTPDDVKQQVDIAFGQLVSPLRMKEHLIAQLKTQVADLERFINYLQNGTKKQNKCSCGCPLHSVKRTFGGEGIGAIQRITELLQIFAFLHFGCDPSHFKKNNLKNTAKGNHWGDLRARLELAIVKVLDLIKLQDKPEFTNNNGKEMVPYDIELTKVVRKHLAGSIRDLIQHGVSNPAHSQSLVPFINCFARQPSVSNVSVHAWEIIVEYYHLKNGEKYNSTPARKLSQSFNLELVGSTATSNKQGLLSVIGNIISTHTPYKRSYDSHFKAFICASLNANKLVVWLNLILQCQQLINKYYMPWSYVAKTGFRDSLQSLDKLTKYDFNLPVDLAVHQFQNIKDIFT